ncbi:MAG TPA: hypothetical protein VKM72_31960 [Thermoanaerobaculia bacterium]|nr:hypothetical protein [Thermoanaerobaculia bacterium]
MTRIHRIDPGWLVVLALAGAAPPAAAVMRPVIAVRCEIPAPSLTSLYGPLTPQIAADLCRGLVQRLRQHRTLSLWKYEIGASSQAVLLFQVADDALGNTLVRADLLLDGVSVRAEGPWERRWRSAADAAIIPDPLPEEAAGLLGQAFTPLLMDTGLEEHLKRTVPIAVGGRLTSDAGSPRIISPLPWQDFQRLKNSIFLVSCDWPARNDKADLVSRGHSASARFEPGGSERPYEALVLVASRRQYQNELKPVDQILPEVRQLEPKLIFLQQFEPEMEVFQP